LLIRQRLGQAIGPLVQLTLLSQPLVEPRRHTIPARALQKRLHGGQLIWHALTPQGTAQGLFDADRGHRLCTRTSPNMLPPTVFNKAPRNRYLLASGLL